MGPRPFPSSISSTAFRAAPRNGGLGWRRYSIDSSSKAGCAPPSSWCRTAATRIWRAISRTQRWPATGRTLLEFGGADGDRTRDLVNAIIEASELSRSTSMYRVGFCARGSSRSEFGVPIGGGDARDGREARHQEVAAARWTGQDLPPGPPAG